MASIQPSTFWPFTVKVLAFTSIFSTFPRNVCSFFPAGAFLFCCPYAQDRSRLTVIPVKSANRTYFISPSPRNYCMQVAQVQQFQGTSLYVKCGRFSIMAEKIRHPKGLSTLFFTEMWERFSYYGMRAFLILYMTAPAAAGGLGFADAQAGSIYGTYTGSVWGA